MSREIINIGTGNLTGDGESIRSAFNKSNNNFEELFSLTNFNSVTSNIIPSEDEVYDLGSPTNKWKSLYISSSTIYFNSTPLTIQDNVITVGTGSEQISFATEDFVIQQIANIVESDTVFSASTAASITATDVTNWNTAYSWGDHNAAGYLTSVTETDPIFSSSTAASITATDVTNWNTAYSWGDHSTAGYLTSTNQIFNNGNLNFPDGTSQSTAFNITDKQIINSAQYVNSYAGSTFAISNDKIIIGNFRENTSTGVCYVYELPSFTLLRTINNPSPSTYDYFGSRVDLYENNAVILKSDQNLNITVVYSYNILTGNINYQIPIVGDSNSINVKLTDQYLIISQPEIPSKGSPLGTLWNSDLGDGTGWNDLTNVENRIYVPFVTANNYSVGNNVLNNLFIMYDTINNKYYKIQFTSWTQGGAGGGFSYTRQQINSTTGENIGSLVTFIKTDNGNEVDIIDTDISITRGTQNSIYNPELEQAYTEYDQDGRVYIHDRNTGNLIYTIYEPDFYDSQSGGYKYYFSESISIYNNYLMLSSLSGDNSINGLVYIYDITQFTGTNKVLTTPPVYTFTNPNFYTSSGSDGFGSFFDINEKYIVISATVETDSQNNPGSGVIYVYDLTQINPGVISSSTYTILNPNLSDTPVGDALGLSIKLYNNNVIAGTGDGTNLLYIYNIDKFSSTTVTTPDTIIPSVTDLSTVVSYKADIYQNYLIASETSGISTYQINVYALNIASGTSIDSVSDINVNSVTFNSGVNFKMVPAPASNLGTSTDVAGLFAADGGYFYYCVANYDGDTSIWRRMPWNSSSDTWPQQA